mgnify:CR=1 FL=1
MSLQNWVLGVAGVVVVFGLWYGATHPKAIIDATKVDVNAIARAVLDQVQSEDPTVGSVTGPDSVFPCETHNGVQRCFTQKALKTATSTVCAIQTPTATSTIVSSTVVVNVGTSTATTWFISKGTTAFSSTTAQLGTFALASAVQGTMRFVASTTAQTAFGTLIDDLHVFSPNTWLIWSIAGVAPNDSSRLAGRCNATFEAI